MTWNEVKLATLQKLFSGEGNTISESDESVQQYLAAMPQAANEAAALLCSAGCGLRQTEILTMDKSTLDLQYALPRMYPADPLELYRKNSSGMPEPVSGAKLTAGRYLTLPGGGDVLAVYTLRPEALSRDSAPETVIQLPEDAAVLLPLYMASQLYKDDDLSIAIQYRNEFEAALEQLPHQRSTVLESGFESVSGWV